MRGGEGGEVEKEKGRREKGNKEGGKQGRKESKESKEGRNEGKNEGKVCALNLAYCSKFCFYYGTEVLETVLHAGFPRWTVQ